MRKFHLLLAVTLAFITHATAQTNGITTPVLKEAAPEAAGMSADRLARIDQLFKEYVDKKWVPSVTAMVVRDGKIVYYKTAGYDNPDKKSGLHRDDIYRIASQSKAITSVAVMILYEEGKFLLDDPISKYIPEFSKPTVLDSLNLKDSTYSTKLAKREITIRDLLTHTSGIGYAQIGDDKMNAIYGKSGIPSGIGVEPGKILATEIKKLAKLPLMHEPGAKFTYGLNTDVLGYLVEVVSGKSFNDFLRERIFEPLGMQDTYFYLPKKKYDRLTTVTLEDSMKRIVVVKSTYHGFNVNYPNTQGTYFSGGAGLSSTAYDYAIFLQMMLNGGIYNGHRILSRNAVRMMTMSQLRDIPYGDGNSTFGLGFGIITEKGSAILPVREGTYQWGGYWGTTYWVDPKERIVGQIMTQHEDDTHGDLFDKFKVLVYQAIND